MNRRKFIAGAGGIGAATLGGAALMGSVSADEHVETGWFGVRETHEVDSQSGRLKSLTLENIQLIVQWENFSHAATHFNYTLSAKIGDKSRDILEDSNISLEGYEENNTDSDYDGEWQDGVGDAELIGPGLFDPEDIETPHEDDDTDYTEDTTYTHNVEFTLSVDVHHTGKAEDYVNGAVTGEGHIQLTNLGAEKAAGGTGEFDSEEETEYDPGEEESDPDPVTVEFPADDIVIDGWEEGGVPVNKEITIHNNRSYDVQVVVEWVNAGEGQGSAPTKVYFVEAGGSTGPVGNNDGDTYEG